MTWAETAESNLLSLQANEYPGRGIIIGLSPDGGRYLQVYWLMGRSAASRNRVLVAENGFVRTAFGFQQLRIRRSLFIIRLNTGKMRILSATATKRRLFIRF